MKETRLSSRGEETHALIFETGDEVMATILEYVKRRRVRAAHFSGIGAFRSATLAYFDWQSRKYLKLPVARQVEVLVLTGDIAWKGNEPVAHIHVVVGCRDGSTRGGHLVKAIVRPTLEVIFSEAGALQRRHDPESGLALIAPGLKTPGAFGRRLRTSHEN